MTVGELRDFQRQNTNAQRHLPITRRSSAMGQYQIMPNTLADAQKSLNFKDSDLFTPELQERIAISGEPNLGYAGLYEADAPDARRYRKMAGLKS